MSTPSIRRFALSAACILALAGQAAVAAPPAVSGKPGPQPGGGYLHADGFLSKGDMLIYVGMPRAAEAPAQAAVTPAPQPASVQADRIAVSERSKAPASNSKGPKLGPQPGGGYLHADGFLSKGDMLIYVGVPTEARQGPAQFAGEGVQGQEPSATQTR